MKTRRVWGVFGSDGRRRKEGGKGDFIWPMEMVGVWCFGNFCAVSGWIGWEQRAKWDDDCGFGLFNKLKRMEFGDKSNLKDI
jgi:hypothetical protein